MHKYIPETHRGRMRVASNYYVWKSGGQEIRSSGGQGVRRSGVREGFILEEGGRQLSYGKINTHHFIMCF